jgi:hypothetical protein
VIVHNENSKVIITIAEMHFAFDFLLSNMLTPCPPKKFSEIFPGFQRRLFGFLQDDWILTQHDA